MLEDVEDEVVSDSRGRGGNTKTDLRISSGVGLSCFTTIPIEANTSCERLKNSLAFIYFIGERVNFF